MSRCFPYPPPGYALTSARKEALIESIKFQKEKVKTEEQRKKGRKREKKEKKIRSQENINVSSGRCIGEKFWSDPKVGFLPKGSNSEERSTLTEEHAKLLRILVPSSSSDSTENSNKRKRLPSPVDHNRGHVMSGKIIRIRLSSNKQNQPNTSVDEQKQCSTSGRTQFSIETCNDTSARQRTQGFWPTLGSTTNSVGKSLVLMTGGERNHIFSKHIEIAPVFETEHLPAVETVMAPFQKEGLLYKYLIESLAPPSLRDGRVDTANEDWLFGAKKNKVELFEMKTMCRDDSTTSWNTSWLWWPHTQFLPEVDVCALPYTLPF